MKITVYSTDNCFGCTWTMDRLDEMNLEYTEINLSGNQALIDDLTSKGYMGAPVVVVNDFERAWTGVNPQALSELR